MMPFLAEVTTVEGLGTAIAEAIPMTSVVNTVATGLAVAAPAALTWFGIRYVKRAITRGVFRGRI